MAYVKSKVGIGCKYLTDNDLGIGNQTHIGLLGGVFDLNYNESVIKNVPIYVCDSVGSGTICLDFIARHNGNLESPKIRIGRTDEEKASNIARSIRTIAELFPNRKWFMFFSVNRYEMPFFAFLLEDSYAWNEAKSMGLDFEELDKKVITSDSPVYETLSYFISTLFEGELGQERSNHKKVGEHNIELSSKGYNRIVFGAPGTGKSFLLNQETKVFIDDAKELSEIEKIKEEVFKAGKNRSKNYAIGLKYHKQFAGKKPIAVSQLLDCSGDEAYCIVQGAKAFALIGDLSNYDESSFSETCIRTEYEKIVKDKDSMKQACAALVGYKYADLIEKKPWNEFNDVLGQSNKSSLGSWINYGIKAADYKYDTFETGFFKRFERVTFHPDYSYAQFVGTYKPVKSQQEEASISYDYVPGPFIRVLVNALKYPKKSFLLLIEEINRANVAAVFGDTFQLLDRNSEGFSLYPIEASEDLKNYLSSVGIESETVAIPSNMFIWATMNSADQGVFFMDTAFKRRWDFEYIGINDNENEMKESTVVLGKGDNAHKIKWNDLRHAINDYLADDLKINEDKQLGPYFIGRKIVVPENGSEIDSKIFNSVFKNKVLMYLFDDAAKQKRASLFAGVEKHNNRYSAICEEFDKKGMYIFNSKICSAVEIIKDTDSTSETDNQE